MKTFLWIRGALIAGIVLIAFVEYAGTRDTNNDTADPQMNAQQRRDIPTLIRHLGYHCPAANLALAKGEDIGGTVVKVWCGPPGTTDVYQNLVFRVTRRPDGSSSGTMAIAEGRTGGGSLWGPGQGVSSPGRLTLPQPWPRSGRPAIFVSFKKRKIKQKTADNCHFMNIRKSGPCRWFLFDGIWAATSPY